MQSLFAIYISNALDLAAQDQLNAFVDKGLLDNLSGLGIFPVQHMAGIMKECHFAAQSPERLGQFTSNRPATDHRQPFGLLHQVPDRFVGQKASFHQARNGRMIGA